MDYTMTLYSFITVWKGVLTSAVQLIAAASLVGGSVCIVQQACSGKLRTAWGQINVSLAGVWLATWTVFFSTCLSGRINVALYPLAEHVVSWENPGLSAGTAYLSNELPLNPSPPSLPSPRALQALPGWAWWELLCSLAWWLWWMQLLWGLGFFDWNLII